MRPTLETPRLRLEPLTADHVDPLAALDGDPEVMRQVPDARGLGCWVGFRRGELVGWWCLVLDEEPTTAELGHRLARAAWGRGLATEGARALLDHGFETVGLASVRATARDTDLASQQVLEKSGLRHVSSLPADEPSLVRYAVTREQWADVLIAAVRRCAAWEDSEGSQAEARHLARLGPALAVPRLVECLLDQEDVDLTDDAGDGADEVWRARTAVLHGLLEVGEPARPWLEPWLARPLGWPAYVAARTLAPYAAAQVGEAVARWRREADTGGPVQAWMLAELTRPGWTPR